MNNSGLFLYKEMYEMKKDSIIKEMLEKYKIHDIDQNKLIENTKKIFHDELKQNKYELSFIKEYFFMTEILDLQDCNKQECEKFVSYYLNLYEGKESAECNISIFLAKELLTEEVLEVIEYINQFITELQISAQGCNAIKSFIEKRNNRHQTLYDFVIEQLASLLKWGFSIGEDEIIYSPKSMINICDDEKVRKYFLEKIDSITKVLLGINPVWVNCRYENGDCRLQVIL